MDMIVPEEWAGVLDALSREKGIAILLGATDTGKSTFAKFLIAQLCRRQLRVALVDADIGQSTLGPPATIGLAVFEPPLEHMRVSLTEICFVGSTTPEGNIPLHLNGVKRMMDKALSGGAEVILIDTTGFILGKAGMEFKRRKIDLLMPRFLLALQKSGEIEDLLSLYEGNPLFKILRLSVPEGLRPRSKEERAAYRAGKLEEYFREAKIRKLSIRGIGQEGGTVDSTGFTIPPEWALGIKGLLIGLSDMEGNTLGLGLIRSYDDEEGIVKLLTPFKDLKRVKSIQFSSLRLSPAYEEERF